jgi:drug/metabolite transporter (DMT)-like permease
MTGAWEIFAARAAPMVFVFLWSTGFIGAKFGLPYAEPLTFLAVRMAIVVAIFAVVVAVARPPMPTSTQTLHATIAGSLVHVTYLGGVFSSIAWGIPAGISALIPGLQPVLTATLANRFLGERVTAIQWLGLLLGLAGIALVLHDRTFVATDTSSDAGLWAGWIATFVSLFGITIGTLYQKRYCGAIDWRANNLVQYTAAAVLFALGAFLFETRDIRWTGEFVFSLAWLIIVMSVGAVSLMYWLIRHAAASQVASLFYLVPAVTAILAWLLFDERLDALAIAGMVACAVGVFLVNWRRAA